MLKLECASFFAVVNLKVFQLLMYMYIIIRKCECWFRIVLYNTIVAACMSISGKTRAVELTKTCIEYKEIKAEVGVSVQGIKMHMARITTFITSNH